MSERLPGLEVPDFVPAKTRDASAVVVHRRTARGVEVFWIKREKTLKFAGGFYAFPGGKVDAADAQVPVEGATGLEATLRVTAARELFEETGLLVAKNAERLDAARRDALRRALLDETLSFGELVKANGLVLRASDFPAAGRWVTPPYLPVRFDARFFLVEVPTGQEATVWPGELSFGGWTSSEAALAQWRDGTALLHPPNRHALEVFGRFQSREQALAELNAPPHCVDFVAERLEFQQGVHVVPLVTATLPPATHTNAYLLGTKSLLLVDPGTDEPSQLEPLLSLARQRVAEGATLEALVLTHHHGDHTAGAKRVMAELGVPLWAHARTADRVGLPCARSLNENDLLELAGGERWRVRFTPGHAAGHVCLVDERSKAAVVGDMVAGQGTIVIDPPEGDMASYVRELERLIALGVTTLYAAHGATISDGPGKLAEYVQHRTWREAKVKAALLEDFVALGDLVPKAYDDVQAFVWPLAERSTLAILEKLRGQGEAKRDDVGRWAKASN